MRKPETVVVFPLFYDGGAESVCMWILEALKERCQLTLLTFSDVTLSALNARHGTALDPSSVKILTPLPRAVGRRLPGFSFRQHVMSRWIRSANRFDVAVSAMNEMDFGRPGIQYVHYPMFGRGVEGVRALVGYPSSRPSRVYRHLLRHFTGFSDARMLENMTLVNSRWTAGMYYTAYGRAARVVYPPVMANFPDIAWEDREDGFVIVGRLVPEKQVERAIAILAKVRDEGFPVHLHITAGRGDPAYIRKIRRLGATRPWVHLEPDLDRAELALLVATHRYGIHARANEHFGIAVAELLAAGCIPFVPDRGGQLEIVGESPELAFGDDEDAMRKICAVLAHPQRQVDLRTRLRHRVADFSESRFVTGIQGAFDDFLAAAGGPTPGR
jgi:glycosyltransferase involved in cell wall biosynthesis